MMPKLVIQKKIPTLAMLHKTHVMILAAGNSSRMGTAKQSLMFGGKSLLQRAIDATEHPYFEKPLVVLGAFHQAILKDLDTQKTDCLIHPKWKEGMGGTLKFGLSHLLEKRTVEQLMVLLCDQPFVETGLLQEMVLKKEISRKPIVACAYSGTIGVPVLFDRQIFPRLFALQPEEGAKQLLKQLAPEVAEVPFPKGEVDIDTMEDFRILLSGSGTGEAT